MSTTSVHDDWLSLIEISGPFLAVPVLKEAFPQGLEELDATKRKRLRQAYEEWREALDEATSTNHLEDLADEVASHRREALQALQDTADQRADFEALARQVRALMFVERFRSELEQRLDRLDH